MRDRHIKFIAIALLAVCGFTLAVQLLWNALLPAIFNLPAIGFFQAAGLLILTRILFGGRMPMLHRRRMGRQAFNDKWQEMAQGDRERFMSHFFADRTHEQRGHAQGRHGHREHGRRGYGREGRSHRGHDQREPVEGEHNPKEHCQKDHDYKGYGQRQRHHKNCGRFEEE